MRNQLFLTVFISFLVGSFFGLCIGYLGFEQKPAHLMVSRKCSGQKVGKESVAYLMKILRRGNFLWSEEASKKLAALGDKAIPALCEGAQHWSLQFRNRVFWTFQRLKSSKAIPCLRQLLKHQNPLSRSSAIEALWRMGPKARVVLPELLAMTKESNSSVLSSAVRAVGRLGNEQDAKKLLKRIQQFLHHKDKFVRIAAKSALVRLKKKAKGIK